VRINFRSKRIWEHFKNNYEISFDKPKKNMEKYEYMVKIYKNSNI